MMPFPLLGSCGGSRRHILLPSGGGFLEDGPRGPREAGAVQRTHSHVQGSLALPTLPVSDRDRVRGVFSDHEALDI